jgi:hypothetical protein
MISDAKLKNTFALSNKADDLLIDLERLSHAAYLAAKGIEFISKGVEISDDDALAINEINYLIETKVRELHHLLLGEKD